MSGILLYLLCEHDDFDYELIYERSLIDSRFYTNNVHLWMHADDYEDICINREWVDYYERHNWYRDYDIDVD